MKVIIAGSRDIDDMQELVNAVVDAERSGIQITEVVSGGARGVDTLASMWANAMNIPFVEFKADWEQYGHYAGFKRNVAMAESGAEALILVWDGKSNGSRHMLSEAKKRGLKQEEMCRSPWVYNRLRRFRAGIESGISWLKRCFGLTRCTWKSFRSFKSYVWASIVSANLMTLGRCETAAETVT